MTRSTILSTSILSLLLCFVLTGAVHAQARAEPLVAKVKGCITSGVEYLISQQSKADGSWEATENSYKGGSTALVLLALLNCEGVLDQPLMEQARKQSIEFGLKHLRGIDPPTTVYVRALQTMALAEGKHNQDRGVIERNVQWLLDARVYRDGRFIGWGYEKRAKGMTSDASNSQYAMLALWYARQAGVPIKRDVWVEIRAYYASSQNDDGSWIYSKDYGPNDIDKDRPSVSMTVAGLCGLLIAGMELNGEREQFLPGGQVNNCGKYGENTAVTKALYWLNHPRNPRQRNFTIDLQERTYYHLYGLERAGRLSGLRFFGEHDWYREGCELLTSRQARDGSWKTHGGWDRWPLVNTSFALLFLAKGQTPVLMSKLVHGSRAEWDLDWNNDRNDLRHLTEYVSRTDLFGKKAIAWQTYDISRAIQARSETLSPSPQDETDIVADMLQSPILYITGHKSPLRRFQDVENRLIQRYIQNGGFIIAEACCGSKDFDEGFKEWIKENWEGSELKYLEAVHPVWTCFYPVPAGEPYKLMSLNLGCRTVMLYSPQDLSCYWESNRRGDGRTELAFRLGSNMIAYATGRIPPQPRLTPIVVASEKSSKAPGERGSFEVAQLRDGGEDWLLAPKAMNQLMAHVHKITQYDVVLATKKIRLGNETEVSESKFIYMHGRNSFKVDKDHFKALRFTLEFGGLLFGDACCGDEEFDKSFRQFVAELFPKEKLQRVPVDPKRDALFRGASKKEEISAANIKCRTRKSGPLAAMEPYLEGIQINGRWVVLYSKYDIGCALEGHTSHDCIGYDPASAMRLATAVVLYQARP